MRMLAPAPPPPAAALSAPGALRSRPLLRPSLSTRGRRRRPAEALAREPVVAPRIPVGPNQYMDLWGYLYRNRIIYIGSKINDQMAMKVVSSLLALEAQNPTEDIRLYINCPGGQIYSVMAIYDAMHTIKPDVSSVALGLCASTSNILLAGAAKGKRYALENARMMINQPMGGAMGTVLDVKVQTQELKRQRAICNEMYASFTGQSLEDIQDIADREKYFSAKEAVEFGLIDAVV